MIKPYLSGGDRGMRSTAFSLNFINWIFLDLKWAIISRFKLTLSDYK